MTPSTNRGSLLAFLVAFIGLFVLVSASSPAPSPSAETELICRKIYPAECYPKVFQATDEFQVVHEDQELPPGLHVRIDVNTGKKEAKLNNPNEVNPELEGLPVDQAVLVVDPEATSEELPVAPGAPKYEPVGQIKEPKEKNNDFHPSLSTVKKVQNATDYDTVEGLDQALVDLEDLSHDIYWGLKITEDPVALQALFCLLTERSQAQGMTRPLSERRDFRASLILSSAIRNNPTALKELEKTWNGVMSTQCKKRPETLKEDMYACLKADHMIESRRESLAADWARVSLSVWGGLMKSKKIRTEFMEQDGMKALLKILMHNGEIWQAAQIKAARIVSDTFLDENMGATLGIWPVVEASDDAVCKNPETTHDEGCWDYHLAALSKQSSKDHWSRDLFSMLKANRKTQKPKPRVKEL